MLAAGGAVRASPGGAGLKVLGQLVGAAVTGDHQTALQGISKPYPLTAHQGRASRSLSSSGVHSLSDRWG